MFLITGLMEAINFAKLIACAIMSFEDYETTLKKIRAKAIKYIISVKNKWARTNSITNKY